MAISTNIFEKFEDERGVRTVSSPFFLSCIRSKIFPARYTRNRYFAWRHGESRANKECLIVSSLENGKERYGLTSRGVQQVQREAARMRQSLDLDLLLFSSPFLRCIESAQIIAEELGITSIASMPELRERYFGQFEKKSTKNYKRVYRTDLLHPEASPHSAESVASVRVRITSLVIDMEEKYSGKTIVLVTHADIGEILQTALLAIPPHAHRKLPKLRNGECRELYAA